MINAADCVMREAKRGVKICFVEPFTPADDLQIPLSTFMFKWAISSAFYFLAHSQKSPCPFWAVIYRKSPLFFQNYAFPSYFLPSKNDATLLLASFNDSLQSWWTFIHPVFQGIHKKGAQLWRLSNPSFPFCISCWKDLKFHKRWKLREPQWITCKTFR